MSQEPQQDQIAMYSGRTGAFEVRLVGDTLWLSFKQIPEVFGRAKSVFSRQLRNIFRDGKLERDSVVSVNATTLADGKVYQVECFNVDAIIAVGYRVNSVKGTRFRKWVTRILRDHLMRGYTLNRPPSPDFAGGGIPHRPKRGPNRPHHEHADGGQPMAHECSTRHLGKHLYGLPRLQDNG